MTAMCFPIRRVVAVVLLAAATAVSGCSGEQMVDRTVDSTLWVGKTVVKGTVGAGKLAVRGAGKAMGSGR